ncbi:bifunctional riboflavin kinase/FAD synthetase [Mesobaculum littorinae]|uniref:Riboflavin biosynthesis protein n=1 Tax=Mesobaculum littorinae TaxID=2486419 RepID=A0A438AKH8_9RHOB|nr:bifunctional riboflavin kinase/FAD synthetase [Mesobaculum littorinae]RVV99125.1 bifunctional riboflavin kinase/FAD synthetase [Mesobaculum littorinae]
MRIVRDHQFVAEGDRGASAAIGNFDGVHLGHRAVIDLARAEAVRLGAPLGVMTFEPHPREFFAPDSPPFRLMNAEARANRLDRLGVDLLYELPFDTTLSQLPARAFAEEVIARGLGLRHVVVGRDFRFGKGRDGDADALAAFGEEFGFGVTRADLLETAGLRVSSTSIREALAEGRVRDATAMLGHHHRIEGAVLHGDRRGRDLGYPTANMSIAGLHQPRLGVYAVRVRVLTGAYAGDYDGVASIGTRPTFGVNAPNIETFLFDFRGDLYGEHLSVALVEFLRPELKFDDLDSLIAQMDDDSAHARSILAQERADQGASAPLDGRTDGIDG